MQSSTKFIGVTAAVGAVAIIGTGTAVASPLEWTECGPIAGVSQDDVPAGVECAQLQVPVDYAHPTGAQTTIAMSRIKASSGTSQSTIFGNPGGPGNSALSFWSPRSDEPVPAGLYEDHDLVAVQPRGLTGSHPLDCDPRFVGPRTVNAFHDACFGVDPAYMASLTTENEARDMNAVREALGLARIDFVGQSYGTKIGADYATLFPEHTGRMVLDSNVDPGAAWGRQSALTTRAQEQRIYDMFQWIADRNDYYGLGDTPLKVFGAWKRITDQEVGGAPNLTAPAAVAADLPRELRGTALEQSALDVINTTAPGRARAEGFWRAVTLQDLFNNAATGMFDSTVGATSTDRGWPMLAHMLRYYEDGGRIARVDYPTAAKMIEARNSGARATSTRSGLFEAVTCNENATPVNLLAVGAARIDNLFGGNALVDRAIDQENGGGCLGYAPVARPITPNGDGLTTGPLLLNSQRDSRTPLSGAEAMQRALGGTLVTVGGGDHGVFRSGNAPVDDVVMRFLRGEPVAPGTLPGPAAPVPMPKYGPAERAASGVKGLAADTGAFSPISTPDAPAPSAPIKGADDWYGVDDTVPAPAVTPPVVQQVDRVVHDVRTAVDQAGAQLRAALGQPGTPAPGAPTAPAPAPAG